MIALQACDGPARDACTPSPPLGTICGFENPEDLEWLPRLGVILVSNMRTSDRVPTGGFLAALDPVSGQSRRVWPTGRASDAMPDPSLGDPQCPGPPDGARFAPHGITATGSLLYVVGHPTEASGREAVEIFAIEGEGPELTLTWKACIPHEPRVMANDIVVAPSGDVFVTNYQPDDGLRPMLDAHVLRRPVGDVRSWRRDRGWRVMGDMPVRQPNGIALTADGRTLFFTEIATGRIHRLTLDGTAPAASVAVDGHPDNLTWTARGTLLVASHTAGSRFLWCRFGATPCRTSWVVHEIDPGLMTATERYAHDGDAIGAVATALEVGERLYLGSVFDDRVGVLVRP